MSCTLKVTLRDVEPVVWRRLKVPADFSLCQLERALIDAMQWFGISLSQFHMRDGGPPIPDHWGDDDANQWFPHPTPTMRDLFAKRSCAPFDWEYNLQDEIGDGWCHDVVLEAVDENDHIEKPVCLEGERACPPDDPVRRYDEFLADLALFDDAHEEGDAEERVEFLEMHMKRADFDPAAFDPATVRFRKAHIRRHGWLRAPATQEEQDAMRAKPEYYE